MGGVRLCVLGGRGLEPTRARRRCAGRVHAASFLGRTHSEVGEDGVDDLAEVGRQECAVVSEVYVDGALVAAVNGYRDAVNISRFASPGRKEVKLITRAIDGVRATNWIRLEIGRISTISSGRYRYASMLEIENRGDGRSRTGGRGPAPARMRWFSRSR